MAGPGRTSRRTRWLGWAAALFVAIQFIPVGRANPPVTAPLEAPPEISSILRNSCADCHSHETRWPWYSRVAPVSFLIAYHADRGREYVNFSMWGMLSERERLHALEEIVEVVESGEMPLTSYLLLHPEARLDGTERQALTAWARSAR